MAVDHTHVTVADDGTETIPAGSVCSTKYALLRARAVAQLAKFQQSIPTGAEGAPMLKGLADVANDDGDFFAAAFDASIGAAFTAGFAAAIATVKARIPGSMGGLQRIPNPVVAGGLTDSTGGATIALDIS